MLRRLGAGLPEPCQAAAASQVQLARSPIGNPMRTLFLCGRVDMRFIGRSVAAGTIWSVPPTTGQVVLFRPKGEGAGA